MAVTKEDIAKQYIAYYDRAPDYDGLSYWINTDSTLDEISASFADQQETADKYPFTLTSEELVNTIYQNVFNRDADTEGLAYWVAALDDGSITRSQMIIAVVNGAQGRDQRTLDNKVVVGLDYANNELNDLENAAMVMDGISDDIDTVVAAREQIDGWAQDAVTINYTTQRDLVVGTDSENRFEGLINGTQVPGANADTFQEMDVTDGGEGEDTLHITSDITADRISEPSSLYNVENVQVTQNGNNTLMLDATNFDESITTVVSDSSATALGDIFFGVQADGHALKAVANIELGAKNGGVETTVVYENDVVSSVANSAEITLLNGVAQTFTSSNISAPVAIESYTIHTTGSGNQALTLNDLATTTIKVDGKAQLSLIDGIGFVTKVDASTATGSLIFTPKAADALVMGGKGSDVLTGATDSILIGGLGDDTLIAGGSGTIFSYTKYTDSTLNSTDSLIGFRAGSDTINVTEAVRNSGHNATDAAVTAITASVKSLGEGEAYSSSATAGVTHAYQDTVTNYLYVDINQDNIFNQDTDLVIDAGTLLLAGDLIV